MVSGLRQVVLALLTLSNDGCKSLHRRNIAIERNKDEKEIETEKGCRRTEEAKRGLRKMRLTIAWENKGVDKRNTEKVKNKGG